MAVELSADLPRRGIDLYAIVCFLTGMILIEY